MEKERYLHNMLVYWDPWSLIGNGAPEDEYDSYIQKLLELVNLRDENEIRNKVRDIFSQYGMPSHNLERAIAGISEGIQFLNKD